MTELIVSWLIFNAACLRDKYNFEKLYQMNCFVVHYKNIFEIFYLKIKLIINSLHDYVAKHVMQNCISSRLIFLQCILRRISIYVLTSEILITILYFVSYFFSFFFIVHVIHQEKI